MPVALLPPVTSSYGMWRGEQPLTAAARYIRGRGNSRWHRIRCATRYPEGMYEHRPQPWTVYQYWCGPGVNDAAGQGLMLVDDVPAGEPVCGTCVGRALGAGQDDVPANLPKLRFDPRWQAPPPVCPGSRKDGMVEPLNTRLSVGKCRACGAIDSTRPVGSGYHRFGYGMVKHPPGPDLVPGCPFHGWHRITVHEDNSVGCGCGYPGGAK